MKLARFLPKPLRPQTGRGKVVFWACVAALIFGALRLGSPLDYMLRDWRSKVRAHPAPHTITLVAIDDKSLSKLGNFPWPRRHYGDLVTKLHRMGARRIVFDIFTVTPTDPANDKAFADALVPLGNQVVLPIQFSIDAMSGKRTDIYPLPEFRARADLAHTNFRYDAMGAVRRLPYALAFGNDSYPSLAAKIAGAQEVTGDFPIDYSISPAAVPKVSAIDVMNGTAPHHLISGKDVIIGATFTPLGDSYIAPGHGVIPGVYLHILGALTLREGKPLEFDWWLGLIPAILIMYVSIVFNRRVFTCICIASSGIMALMVPFWLDSILIFLPIAPTFFFIFAVGLGLSWISMRKIYRARGTTNLVSGLPNLSALHELDRVHDRILIAARIHNFAAIASTLDSDGEKALVDQIAKRLMIGVSAPALYQGDEGIFAWFAASTPSIGVGSHLDALHTVFRSSVSVFDKQYDLSISFGVDSEVDRAVSNRLASALVAADEAYREGLKWKEHDNSKLEDSAWRLSLLSQLDAAIDAGDMWVAYQPKYDLAAQKIVGAEALARWTHPGKGAISPVEFILAAEQNNRIEKLTYFVMENAVRAAAAINRQMEFSVAVNLSARLINDSNLVERIDSILAQHRLLPSRLTLEVTETAALTSNTSLDTLHELRDRGIKISVDDYGTGMSTLEYLQRIPATEIKIDRSFVKALQENHATRLMVHSTIQLAHSLGQRVVAEGVEDRGTMEELARMNCDLIQGYLIGKPMTFRALTRKMLEERNTAAA